MGVREFDARLGRVERRPLWPDGRCFERKKNNFIEKLMQKRIRRKRKKKWTKKPNNGEGKQKRKMKYAEAAQIP